MLDNKRDRNDSYYSMKNDIPKYRSMSDLWKAFYSDSFNPDGSRNHRPLLRDYRAGRIQGITLRQRERNGKLFPVDFRVTQEEFDRLMREGIVKPKEEEPSAEDYFEKHGIVCRGSDLFAVKIKGRIEYVSTDEKAICAFMSKASLDNEPEDVAAENLCI